MTVCCSRSSQLQNEARLRVLQDREDYMTVSNSTQFHKHYQNQTNTLCQIVNNFVLS